MSRGEDVKARMNLLLAEREKLARLSGLRRDITRKADFLAKKSVIEHHEVYQLIKEFFREFLEKRYEFTVNELRAELKKVYISNATRALIASLLQRLEYSEYATVHYTRDDLLKLLADFKEIVEQLVRIHTKKRSLLERIKGFMFKDPDTSTIIAELPAIEGDDAYHVRIYTLIEKCYVALDQRNLHRAKASYDALIGEYQLLDDSLKAQYYAVIQQTYMDLLNRAKMLTK